MLEKERNLKILNAVLLLSTCKARSGTEDKPHWNEKLYDMERKLEKIFHSLVAYTSSAHPYMFFFLDLDIPRERKVAVAVLPDRKQHMLG